MKLSLSDTLVVLKRVAEALGSALNVGRLVFLDALDSCIAAPGGVLNSVKPELKTIATIAPTKSAIGSTFANLEAMCIHIMCGSPGKPKAIKDLTTSNSVTRLLSGQSLNTKDFVQFSGIYSSL